MKRPCCFEFENILIFFFRIKEEPSADIQFPVLDENDEVTEAEHLLQLDGNYYMIVF